VKITKKLSPFKELSARVVMCEYHCAKKEGYWKLQLAVDDDLVEAFHKDSIVQSKMSYHVSDEVRVSGCWISSCKACFIITDSELISSVAVNDDKFEQDEWVQIEMDFS